MTSVAYLTIADVGELRIRVTTSDGIFEGQLNGLSARMEGTDRWSYQGGEFTQKVVTLSIGRSEVPCASSDLVEVIE